MCETPSAYWYDTSKARKEHRCCECRGSIKKGEVYHVHRGIWEGDFGCYKNCEDCEKLRAEVDKNVRAAEDRTPFGYLYEPVFEGRDKKFIATYMEIARRRGGHVEVWMEKREQEALKSDGSD